MTITIQQKGWGLSVMMMSLHVEPKCTKISHNNFLKTFFKFLNTMPKIFLCVKIVVINYYWLKAFINLDSSSAWKNIWYLRFFFRRKKTQFHAHLCYYTTLPIFHSWVIYALGYLHGQKILQEVICVDVCVLRAALGW